MFKFIKSHKHRGLYIKLALKYFMTPDHIRRIAHGQEYETKKEKKVHDILMERGLIRRHQNYDN